jgi:MFS family permease
VAFVANGLGGPSFLPRLPGRQAELGLSDAGLGLVLVGMAAGALVASPLAGRAVGRVGSRPVVVGAAVVLGASLWTAGAAPEPALLFVALAVIGAADASMDIAMNANGAAYERGTGRSLMHRLHGAWSVGALAGAGLAAASAAAGVSLTWQLAAVGTLIAVGVVATRSGLVRGDALSPPPAATAGATGHGDLAAVTSDTAPDSRQNAGSTVPPDPGHPHPGEPAALTGDTAPDRQNAATSPATVPPVTPGSADRPGHGGGRRAAVTRRRALAVLGAVTVAGALIEGGPSDWSAIRLERLGAGPGAAALGLAAFMTGMLAGRLVGDHLTDRFGGRAVLRGGMLLVAAGLGVGALVDVAIVFALGLVVAGLGASGLFPLAFSAAANTPGVAPGTGAATVSLGARLGFIVEPLLMGALAEALGLRWAFLVVAAVAVAVAVAAGRVIA